MHRIQPILLSAVSRSSNSKLVRELSRTGSTVIPAMKNEKEEEVSLATAVVQAQQRLHYTLKYGGRQHPQTLIDESITTLEHLKSIRSHLEGTDVDFESTCTSEKVLRQLRQLTLMHVPASITDDVRLQFQQQIEDLLTGCKKIIFAGLVTCPWYCSTQTDRGLQAKHNTLFVLYLHTDKQFFAPVNHNIKKQSQVIDQGWLYASEASHFAHYLVNGKCRFLETLFLPDNAVLYQTKEWTLLKNSINLQMLPGSRVALKQCVGQAVGAVGTKSSKSGCMRLRETATFYQFCDSFRLLHHAWNILNKRPLHLLDPSQDDLPLIGRVASEKIKAVYEEKKDATRSDLFEIVLKWKSDVDDLKKTFRYTKPKEIEEPVSTWLYNVRTSDKELIQSPELEFEEAKKLSSLLEKTGGSMSEISPENIVMIARAGSYIYNLCTPESDIDYIIIYKETTKTVCGSCRRLTEVKEHRGPQLTVEYGAYEARILCEMLLKGSVVITELVFSDDVDYSSSSWKQLVAHREKFVTEKLIVQIFGLIKNNMIDIEGKRFENTPKERKLFYQIFHKLDILDDLVAGKVPEIRSTGAKREFIMKIRAGPLENDISQENLYSLAKGRIDNVRKALMKRTYRLPENVDFNFLMGWVMNVRGWPT